MHAPHVVSPCPVQKNTRHGHRPLSLAEGDPGGTVEPDWQYLPHQPASRALRRQAGVDGVLQETPVRRESAVMKRASRRCI